MSNETDLDWLARNVHVWREGANYVCVNHTDGGYVFHEHNRNCAIWFTKDQWLARRAELQNKPSWDDAPEWATHLAQNGRGQWWFMRDGEVRDDGRLYFSSSRGTPEITKGEVLGDWRDTLEKRPTDLSEQAVTERLTEATQTVLAAAPALMDEKFRFDRDDWFERGELPPVGTVCQAKLWDRDWATMTIKGYHENTVWAGTSLCSLDKAKFRPIPSERDVLLSVIVEEMNHYDTDGKLADAIMAAGFSLRDR